MAKIAIVLVAPCAAASWVVAVIAVKRMSQHRTPGVSALDLLTHGIALFPGDKLTPEAVPYRRTFVKAALAFVACVVVLMVLSVVGFGLRLGGAPPTTDPPGHEAPTPDGR